MSWHGRETVPQPVPGGRTWRASFPTLICGNGRARTTHYRKAPTTGSSCAPTPRVRNLARLLLFDTPDVDGTLRDNWRRAELVRHAADVLVCILTQQKYNDAAVCEFFAAAAAVDKTVIVVFNMIDWPRQRDLIGGWLATFCRETGVDPVHVYAAPWDADAAEENRLPFYPMSAGATNPRDDLAELHFDEIKVRSFRGSLRSVLESAAGRAGVSVLVERRAGEYREARELLFQRLRLEIDDLPQLPKRLVWDEIWHWLEYRRTRFDRAVNGVYSAVGAVFSRWLGKDPQAEAGALSRPGMGQAAAGDGGVSRSGGYAAARGK